MYQKTAVTPRTAAVVVNVSCVSACAPVIRKSRRTRTAVIFLSAAFCLRIHRYRIRLRHIP